MGNFFSDHHNIDNNSHNNSHNNSSNVGHTTTHRQKGDKTGPLTTQNTFYLKQFYANLQLLPGEDQVSWLDRLRRCMQSSILAQGVMMSTTTNGTSLLHSYETFEEFAIQCTRINGLVTLETIWKILPKENQARTFFQFLLQDIVYNDDKKDDKKVDKTDDKCAQGEGTNSGAKDELDMDARILFINETIIPYFVSFIRRSNARYAPTTYLSSSLPPKTSTSSSGDVTLDETELTLEEFQCWVNGYASRLPATIETMLNLLFFGSNVISFEPFVPIRLLGGSAIITNEMKLLPLAWFNSTLQGEWTNLYSSARDGFSFNRIMHHLIGFAGTTCLIIKCVDGRIFGAVSFDTWKESNQFFGSSRNILFSIHPELSIVRSKAGSNGSYQWLNSNSYGLPHGIGFGGTRERFRFFIPDSLEQCVIHANCLTYESCTFGLPATQGASKSKAFDEESIDSFEIDALEVWGCGGLERLTRGQEAQSQLRAVKDEAIQRARKVDKAAFFDNEFNQEYFLSNTLQHRSQVSDDR